MLNQVSDMAEGLKTRTFRDNSAGINFVVFHETPQSSAVPVRIRNDGSSFAIEYE